MTIERDAAIVAGLIEDAEADRALVADWDETLPSLPPEPEPIDGVKGLRKIVYQWRLYGVPRCAGWMGSYSDCQRLLWPWFDIGGNGEDAMCRSCTNAMHRHWDEEDKLKGAMG